MDNKFFVASSRDNIVIMNLPALAAGISHDDAVGLAAWLVSMAFNSKVTFEEALADTQA